VQLSKQKARGPARFNQSYSFNLGFWSCYLKDQHCLLGGIRSVQKCHICVDEGPQRKSCQCFPVFSVWCNNINTSGDLIVEHSLGAFLCLCQ
jgi:hypothetical protein